jgi:enoyl-CoA hydratase/carnithine racemase
VLSGEGRGFCSGLDLSLMKSLSEGADPRAVVQLAQRAVRSLVAIPVPVVAAIHGVAYGGGLELAIAADIRISSPDASFAAMEIHWGMAPDMAGTQLLPRVIGPDKAKDLIFTGRKVDGPEAERIGLVTRLADDPYQAALAFAGEICEKSPAAIRGAKRLVDLAESADLATGLAAEQDLMGSLIGTPNQIEAMAARNANRKPKFRD